MYNNFMDRMQSQLNFYSSENQKRTFVYHTSPTDSPEKIKISPISPRYLNDFDIQNKLYNKIFDNAI